jgi:nitroreductase
VAKIFPINSPAEFSEFLASRRSTRDFLTDPIEPELLEQLFVDALTAPSWSNTRPFQFAIAQGEVRDRISTEFQNRWAALSKATQGGKLSKVKLFINRYGLPTSNKLASKKYVPALLPRAQRVGKEMYEHFGVSRKDRAARNQEWNRNYQFFNAPVEIFIFFHKSLDIFASHDAGLAIENLILSAHARSLGTCLQGAVSVWEDVVRGEFEISNEYQLLCGLALGYPSDSQRNKFGAHRMDPKDLIVPRKQGNK